MEKPKLNDSKKTWLPNRDLQNPKRSTEVTFVGRKPRERISKQSTTPTSIRNSTPICFTYDFQPKISLEERIQLVVFENHDSRKNSRFLCYLNILWSH